MTTPTPRPWKILYGHDTHRVHRDTNGRIIDFVNVPFEDYQLAVECVNTYPALVEALEYVVILAAENVQSAQDGYAPIYEWAKKALAIAKKGLEP